MSHFYDKHGKPVFEVQCKNGKMRKTNIADARKLDLFPSVTTVLGILAAPELEQWKQNRIIKACKSLPYHLYTDTKTSYQDAIVEEAFKKSETAKDFGDLLHKWIADTMLGTNLHLTYTDIPEATKTAVKSELSCVKRIIGVETTVIDTDLGVAGSYDMFCELQDGRTCLYDYKNQTTLKEDGTPRPIVVYAKSKIQASEYAKIVRADCVRILTVSRDEAGRIETYELSPEEYTDSVNMFYHVASMYRLMNKLKEIKEDKE